MRTVLSFTLVAVLGFAPSSAFRRAADESVDLVRVPNGGIQPEIAVDRAGVVHMVYLAGEPGAADVFYVRSSDSGKTFSRAVRVNSQEGTAIGAGTIRGAQLAIGRTGTVHVAWNGSDKALPRPPVNPTTKRAGMPMLYARANAAGTAFEPQRNLMTETTNLDGGGSIAADDRGGIYVAWHGNPLSGKGGEDERRVWIARSDDDGATFGKERPVSDPATGVCGCCALRLVATRAGELQLLYRSATAMVHRDIYSLVSRDQGRTFEGGRVQGWEIGACPMTSMSIVAGTRVLRAWETDGQVYFNSTAPGDSPKAPAVTATTESQRRKHPRLAVNAQGHGAARVDRRHGVGTRRVAGLAGFRGGWPANRGQGHAPRHPGLELRRGARAARRPLHHLLLTGAGPGEPLVASAFRRKDANGRRTST